MVLAEMYTSVHYMPFPFNQKAKFHYESHFWGFFVQTVIKSGLILQQLFIRGTARVHVYARAFFVCLLLRLINIVVGFILGGRGLGAHALLKYNH